MNIIFSLLLVFIGFVLGSVFVMVTVWKSICKILIAQTEFYNELLDSLKNINVANFNLNVKMNQISVVLESLIKILGFGVNLERI